MLVATRVAELVVCLVLARAFHELTTEITHEVYIGLLPSIRQPPLSYSPLRVFRFSDKTLSAGIEKHVIDGVPIKVFDPEKTIADYFKFRHKSGLDVALEAMKLCRARKGFQLSKLLRYTRLCRVEQIMRPYLEGLSRSKLMADRQRQGIPKRKDSDTGNSRQHKLSVQPDVGFGSIVVPEPKCVQQAVHL